MVGSCAFAMIELIKKVCADINRIKKQIGICLTFLALIRKYRAPKNAEPASSSAGRTCAGYPPALAAFGSITIKTQPIIASRTPIISLR